MADDQLKADEFEAFRRLREQLHQDGYDAAVQIVNEEYWKAHRKFGSFNSPHEGYAVLLEEVDELWAEIKGTQDPNRIRDEAKQVAAMALRLMVQYGTDQGDPTKL